MAQEFVRLPDLAPPVASVGVLGWMRSNLFSSAFNSLLTLMGLYLIYVTVPPILDWLFLHADWTGETRDDCAGEGACWVFVKARFGQFMYGFYPEAERWRVDTAFLIFVAGLAALMVPRVPGKRWVALFLLFAFPFIAYALFYGGVLGFVVVETALWGGLMLTLVIATIGIVASLPIGVVLALGRRSRMPLIRALCVAFIELWRGVPLITVLFMASVMLPLFLPEGVSFDKLLRAFIGVTLFQSAYMAEVVRGGLQAIPQGQYEAAKALGLNYWKMMSLIVLPQALKLVIPGIVNTFIALFKDTTLVLIIGLFDLLGIVQAALTDPNWLGFSIEGYVFAGFGYWIFCFGMSRYSQYIERKLETGHARR
jgi:general L-amino acid transport system permease protein